MENIQKQIAGLVEFVEVTTNELSDDEKSDNISNENVAAVKEFTQSKMCELVSDVWTAATIKALFINKHYKTYHIVDVDNVNTRLLLMLCEYNDSCMSEVLQIMTDNLHEEVYACNYSDEKEEDKTLPTCIQELIKRGYSPIKNKEIKITTEIIPL